MSNSNSQKHLTANERVIIQTGIQNGSTKAAIALTLGKDKSTIGKEIALHRQRTQVCPLPLECKEYKKCKLGRHCTKECPGFIPFKCSRRDRSPGACNGCSKHSSCRFDHFIYTASIADNEYKALLVNSRIGIDISPDELIRIGNIIQPLIKQGQSPYMILRNHPEIQLSEKTIYNYIEDFTFKNAGIDLIPLDLRRVVSRRPISKKESNTYKQRKDRSYLKGRKYEDYISFMNGNPNSSLVYMDTVYNNGSTGPFMQTFKFSQYGFLFIVYHESKTSDEMYKGVLLLESILGKELFEKEVQVILTDRGSEFIKADDTELREDGSRRTRLFYCDPMASGQKGSLEVMHEQIRYICPKETDLHKLGLVDQDSANLMASHINSISYEKLNGKSPIELMEFLSPELAKKFKEFGISRIPCDDVLLKPYLLKK